MAKLRIVVPEQLFEYDIDEETLERYRELEAEVANTENDWQLDDFWDTIMSDTDAKMYWEIADE